MSSFQANPHHLNERINRNFFIFILFMTALLWGYSLFFIPTFDLDESLYRRVAEEMKRSGEWWKPTWDHWALYHKPPMFYWLIAMISMVVDGIQAPVSIFAARLPSLLASVGIAFSLFRFTHNFIAPSLFFAALFPVLTATSVIFDPIQTLFLLPTLIFPTGAFLSKRDLTGEEYLYIGLGLFSAAAFKGLNGLILPTLAYGLHWLLFLRKDNFKEWIKPILRYAAFAFLPATAMTILFYWVLDSNMGRAFTQEFFLVHHLGRSKDAMESHGGSFFYHPLVLLFGGGFLSTFLLYQWMRVRPAFAQYCFPITYALTFVVAFSFSATKLPHYTWPVWPAMALMGAILFQLSDRNTEKPVHKMAGFVASLPVFAIAWVVIAIVFGSSFAVAQLELTPQFKVLMTELANLSIFSRLSLVGCAIVCIAFQAKRSFVVRHPMFTAAFGVTASTLLAFGLAPSISHIMVDPFYEIAKSLKERGAKPYDCIRYGGPHSPTLSIALGHELQHNRCEPEAAVYLIVPQWKVRECEDKKMKILDEKSYLVLCGR